MVRVCLYRPDNIMVLTLTNGVGVSVIVLKKIFFRKNVQL